MLKQKLKNSRVLYTIYYYVMSSFFKLIGLFIPINKNKYLFSSFGGKGIIDSPKYIYEELKKHAKSKNIQIIWALENSSDYDEYVDSNTKIIDVNSLKYFYHVLSSKYWITNTSVERGLSLKKNKQIMYYCPHGIAIKKIGNDIKNSPGTFKIKGSKREDFFLSQGSYEESVLKTAYHANESEILKTGYPRNDKLFGQKIVELEIEQIKKNIGVESGKKIILFAPTYRDYLIQDTGEDKIDLSFLNQFSDEYTILVRLHHETMEYNKEIIESKGNVINVSDYKYVEDLLVVTDILITDFSSILFDFSILEKPIIGYATDFETYSNNRGMYLDIRNEITFIEEINSLADKINSLLDNDNYLHECEKTKYLKNKYIEYGGAASKKVVSHILENSI